MASGTTVNTGASETVSAGGTAVAAAVNADETLDV
jgi:autotransporter passenger strand-loop-strand repeat protein